MFENLKLLKEDMENKDWCIDSFLFSYKQQDFVVLVKLYGDNEKRPDYALLKLEFLKKENFKDSLLVPANSIKLLVDVRTLREYFNIQYSENIGSILQQFNEHLAKFIPIKVINNKCEIQNRAMVISLDKSDSEDPSKTFCYKVKRNSLKADGSLGQRRPYNDNKARILRPTLYQKLKKERNLSFCFSDNPNEEKSDEVIIYNWAKNNKNSLG